MSNIAIETVIKDAMNFPMGRVLDHYMHEYNVSLDDAREHEIELKRFLVLCAIGGAKTRYGIGKPIDDLWHELILSTKTYTEFCQKLLVNTFTINHGCLAQADQSLMLLL